MNKTVLETKRLWLEKITEEHFEDLCSLLSNPVVHQYFPKTMNRQEAGEFFNKIQEKYIEDGHSFWAVMRKSDEVFLGICGLLKQVIGGKEETEVGYRLLDRFWGNGYGTEAAAGCIEYARSVLGRKSVISLISEVNRPSIRVAQKNGLIYEREAIFHGLAHRVYRKRF